MRRPEQAREGKWVGVRQAQLLNIQRKNCMQTHTRSETATTHMSKGNVIVFRSVWGSASCDCADTAWGSHTQVLPKVKWTLH